MIVGAFTKFVDGRWSAEGLTPPEPLLAIGATRAIQCWLNQKPVRTILEKDGPLPDIDALNAETSEEDWELGLDGKPRPPCQLSYVVYLLSPVTADVYTFANSTTGARTAWERLTDKFNWMRAMRGTDVMPLVKPDSWPLKTRFGTKRRPEFDMMELCVVFGPWTPDTLTHSERRARIRSMQALVLIFARCCPEFIAALRDGETDPVALQRAYALLDRIPALPRRKLLPTFADLNRPLSIKQRSTASG
jgi:hypothetical protein